MAKFHGQFQTEGLYPTGQVVPGCWIRDKGIIRFRSKTCIEQIRVTGTFVPNKVDLHSKYSRRVPSVCVRLNNRSPQGFSVHESGDFCWDIDFDEPRFTSSRTEAQELKLELQGVALSNLFALLGRILKQAHWLPKGVRDWLQPFRRQHNNRQLLIRSVSVNGDMLLDLDRPHAAFDSNYLFHHSSLGLNVIGWFYGYLGVGESARACARAARSVGMDVDTIHLKLHLEGGQSEQLWAGVLATEGLQNVTIAHVDAPQSFDLAKAHGTEMSSDNYRIGYWAWELPEFPDAWIQYASVFDEIWCPSEFCREAMAAKLPIPVMTMPHAIEVKEVEGDLETWRKRFALPQDMFLFLFSYDLNSYSPRKNPEAVIEAYRKAFAHSEANAANIGLVLKMHGRGYSKDERSQLEQLKQELPNLFIVDETLSREALTGLQTACDCFVSLHRSEGFGLAVAEMMALGKPVISTNWSATSEFVNQSNGCPVAWKLVELQSNVGPYTKGQVWAEPDTDDAARWMQKVVGDIEFRERIAMSAKNYVLEHLSAAAIGKRYQCRLKAIALFR